MSILVESCNEYLYEGIINSIPLCEADESGDKKTLWQKIKDFFKRIWDWIKDKVLTLFGKKKKNNEDKLKQLEELLKDSKRESSKKFIEYCEKIREGFLSKKIVNIVKVLEKDDDASRDKIEKEIELAEEILDMKSEQMDDYITLRNMNDIKLYKNLISDMENEIKEIEKIIKQTMDKIGKTIPEANVSLLKRYAEILPKSATKMLNLMQESILNASIKVAKENKEV